MPEQSVAILEQGNIFMAFRPTVDTHEPAGIEDVQRLYMILGPRDGGQNRLLVVGRKRLPDLEQRGRQRQWAYVDAVARDPRELRRALEEETYQTRTRGERTRPAARPVAEGIYQILRHRDHTHLAYALELPREPGEVQTALNIEPEASYIASVKNPERGSPPGAGLDDERQASYPSGLQERFGGRRFADLDPPDFLDHPGAEIVLIAAAEDVKAELGIDMDVEEEDASSADIFRALRLDLRAHPIAPLFEGTWE